MSFTTELQYVAIRYMLNELAEEAANVGIVAIADNPPRVISRFLDDPSVKSRDDARIRKEVVQRFTSFLSKEEKNWDFSVQGSASTFFDRLREFGAGLIRVNTTRSVLTNNVDSEFDDLYRQWVAVAEKKHRAAGARDPLRALNRKASSAIVRAFRQGYGMWRPKMFQKQYVVEGASRKNIIDLAMIRRTGNKRREHLFHHVLLFPDAEETFTHAAGLCWRWNDIRLENHAERDLTAVLYEREGHRAQGLSDATELLQESNINVTPLQELPKLARELREDPELALV
jgi:hypothetical protein